VQTYRERKEREECDFFLVGYKFCGLFEKKRRKKMRQRVSKKKLSLLADTHDAERKSMRE
jgi:hypothetical protein